MSLDITELIESNQTEDGGLNQEALQEAINATIQEQFISKDEHQKQIGAVSAKTKKKYQQQNSASTQENANNNAETSEEKAQSTLTAEQVQEMIANANTEREKKAAQEALVETQVSDVKDEFKEFIKFKISNEKDFDIDKFLEENPSYKSVKNTTNTTRTNMSSNVANSNLSEKQRRLLALSGL